LIDWAPCQVFDEVLNAARHRTPATPAPQVACGNLLWQKRRDFGAATVETFARQAPRSA